MWKEAIADTTLIISIHVWAPDRQCHSSCGSPVFLRFRPEHVTFNMHKQVERPAIVHAYLSQTFTDRN